jgi:hypothetical protein
MRELIIEGTCRECGAVGMVCADATYQPHAPGLCKVCCQSDTDSQDLDD